MQATGGGAGAPLNFAVYLDFPAAELEEALTYLDFSRIDMRRCTCVTSPAACWG